MPLITDPSQAKAALELDPDAPATRREVMTYMQNYTRGNLHPMFQQIGAEIAAIIKHEDQAANVVNDLIDFLQIEGFVVGKDGRVRLNQHEFSAFVKKQALKRKHTESRNDA
jgi:hypothetical protein